MKTLWIVLTVVLFFQFSGCNNKEPQNKDSDNSIVRNGVNRVYKRIDYEVKKSFGREDQLRVIGSPRALKTDIIGNIYLLDSKAETVFKLDPDLKYIKNIGQRGEGPGEFNNAICIEIDEKNRLNVADLGHRINIFNESGEHVQTFKTDFLIKNIFINKQTGLITVGYDKILYNNRKKQMIDRLKYFCIADFSTGKKISRDFFSKEQFVFKKIQNNDTTIIIPLFVLFIGNHENIYICSGDKYEITIYGKDRRIKKKIIKEYDPIPVREKDLRIGKDMLNTYPDLRKKFEKIAAYQPIMESIAIDEENRIWIELFIPYHMRKNIYKTQYDLFSKSGRYLYTVEIMEKIVTPLLFKNNHAYIVAEDNSGNYLLKKIKFINIE